MLRRCQVCVMVFSCAFLYDERKKTEGDFYEAVRENFISEKKAGDDAGAACGKNGSIKTGGLPLGEWCLSYNRTKLDETQ